ncbi:GNAT family N-acetyltransferase [Thermithiobacillus tepidarius DSM 3134]|uniref:GNAT family N-acetyltransferase n=1 Tax=Thermithiobacillus tepidarius TaxID=929 RepID=UPI00042195B4|nr:GNAT family N-acetyltransferase [Thermithiobacillus tepidarius]
MIRILNGRSGLGALRAHWQALEAAAPSLFQRYDLALAWWRAFGAGRELAVIEAENGRGRALLPLYRDGERLRVLGSGAFDRLDMLLEGEPPVADIAQGMRRIGCASLEVAATSADGPLARCLAALDSRLTQEDFSAMPLLHTGRWSAADLRAAHPRSAYRHRRLLGRGGRVRALRDYDEARALLAAAFRLKRANLQATGQEDLFADGCHERWLALLARRHLGGLLRLEILSIDGRFAAAVLYFAEPDCWHLYFTVYEPRFAKESPGTVLLWDVLERAAAQAVPRVNFLTGEQWYKLRWHDDRLPLVRLRAGLDRAERTAVACP